MCGIVGVVSALDITERKWLKKGPLRDLFWDTLSSQDCMFDKKITNILLEGQDHGRNNSERLLAIVQFELWRKNFKIVF